MTPDQLAALPLGQRFRLFTQWLGNQPENGRYNFLDVTDCALCQFANSLDGAERFDLVSAGPDDISFIPFGSRKELKIVMKPELPGFKDYALHRNSFGAAYAGFARSAGLPRRGKVRAAIARFFSTFVKHEKPLAA